MMVKYSPREMELFNAADLIAATLAGTQRATHRSIQAERRRAEEVLGRDAAERAADADRDEAVKLVEGGGWAHPDKLRVPPTPELLRSGEFVGVKAARDESASHYIETRTVRRQTMLRITKLHRASVLDDDRYLACKIYRDAFDRSGLVGSYATASLQGEGILGSQTNFGNMARTEWEAESRKLFRRMHAWIDPRMAKVFNLVVIDDLGMRDASIIGKCSEKTARNIVRLGSLTLWQKLNSEGLLEELRPKKPAIARA